MNKDMDRSSPPLLLAQGIEKHYLDPHKVSVLKGIDLCLEPGETVAVVGASGTGKTTLLHILGTLDRPSGGRLFFRGQEVFTLDDKALSAFRNRTIGFVFQFHHLLGEFTALENVMIPALIGGVPMAKAKDSAQQLMERVGLGHRLHHKVGELSGGEQQRVAIARALVMQPSLLLADEPTGNLDPATGRAVFELFYDLNRTLGLTMVMVTHNHDLAKRMDRVVTIEDGRIKDLGGRRPGCESC